MGDVHPLFLSKLINKGNLHMSLEVRTPEFIKPIRRDVVSAHDSARPAPPPRVESVVSAVATHIVGDEVPKDRHADLERDGERDVIEDTQARGSIRNLTFGKRAGRFSWLGELLFFETATSC